MRSSTIGLLAAGLVAVPLWADASTLYGIDSLGGFFRIDPTDGSAVQISSTVGLGLAYNPITGVMYTTGLFDGVLSTINLNTGAKSLVGANGFQMTGLTFSGDSSTIYSFDGNGGPLLAVDPTDGSAAVIGPTAPGVLDLATDSAGNVFAGGFGGIYSVNANTGAATLIGGALIWTAIAFDENDVLYGIEIGSDALYTIDPVTGNGTLVGGDIGGDVRGLAFAFDRAVPEPGTLALLGLGLAGLGLRRRRMVV